MGCTQMYRSGQSVGAAEQRVVQHRRSPPHRRANPGITFHLDEAGAAMMRSMLDRVGAVVSGRRLFDITRGWCDRHPIGAPVVVVTHAPPQDVRSRPSMTFVSG